MLLSFLCVGLAPREIDPRVLLVAFYKPTYALAGFYYLGKFLAGFSHLQVFGAVAGESFALTSQVVSRICGQQVFGAVAGE